MAIRLVKTTCAASTSAGNCSQCDVGNFTQITESGSNYDDCNTARNTPNFTITNDGRKISGVYIFVRRATGAGTLIAHLDEYVTGAWVNDKAISATLTVNTTNFPDSSSALYIPFGTPYTATANNFRIRLVANTVGEVYWWRSTVAGDYAYAVETDKDNASGVTAGDTLLIDKNVIFTNDQATTLAATNSYSLIIGASASFLATSSSPYTLAFGAGMIQFSTKASFKIGSSTTRITNKITITTSLATSGSLMNNVAPNLDIDQATAIEFWGAITNDIRLTLSANANTGQAIVTTNEAIPASWTNGDTVTLAAQDMVGGSATTWTITKGSNQVTLSANLTTRAMQNFALVNITRGDDFGIKISSTNQISLIATNCTIDHYNIDGVYFVNTNVMHGGNISASTCSNLLCYVNNTSGLNFLGSANFTYSNAHFINQTFSTSGWKLSGNNISMSKITVKGWGIGIANASTFQSGSNHIISDFICSNINGAYALFNYNAIGATLTNVRSLGSISIAGSDITFNNLIQGKGNYGTYLGVGVELTFNNCSIGAISANANYDIYQVSNIVSQALYSNCTFGSAGVNNNGNTANGSYIQIHNYNTTVGDDRTWKTYGTFVSDSPSYTNLREEVNQSTSFLSHQFGLLSQTVATNQHYLVATCKLNNAAYYGGTYAHPKIDIYTDGSSSINQTLTFPDNDTSSHTYSQAFTPSTSNNQIVLDVQSKTDATGANADVLFSGAKILQLLYGYNYTTFALGISETLTYPIATITTPVVNPFITTATQATVHAYTGLAFNGTTLTISGAHPEKEIYDWMQDYYSLNPLIFAANGNQFSTIDGVNYIATCNITINAGIALTGAGSINIGTYTWTNGGTYDGTLITSTNQIVHVKLSTPLNTSLYEVYDGSGNIIGSGTANGSTTDILYTHTTDLAVTARVRLFGYLEYVATGTITSSGLTLIISQVADPNTHSYPVGLASDFTIDTTAHTVTHTSGATIYTTLQLYNWTMDYFASLSPDRLQKLLPISAQTQTNFTLQNSYTMDDTSHHFLKGGALTEASGATLWSNIYTLGITAGTQIYIDQNGSTISGWWGTGNIDVLIKVMASSALIDSGKVSVRSHRFNYLYTRSSTDLSGGGRTASALSNPTDSNNQTASATVAGYAFAKTEGVVNHDIGDGLGAQPYTIAFNLAGSTVQQMYEWAKYITRDASGGTIQGLAGEIWQSINYPTIGEVLTSPLGTFAGGKFFGATGIWLANVALADTLNYQLIDNNGITHQAPTPPVGLTGSGIVAGSRIQVYDITSATELDNSVVVGTTYLLTGITIGDTLRIRLTWNSGASYKQEWTTSVVMGAGGASFLASQVDWDAVNAWGIDGSTISIYTAGYLDIYADVNDPAGNALKTEFGAWYAYNNTTADGIRYYFGGVKIPASNVIMIDTSILDLKIFNTIATQLTYTDTDVRFYRSDGSTVFANGMTGAGSNDYSGVPDVITVSSGSGLSTAEHNQLFGLPSAPDVRVEMDTNSEMLALLPAIQTTNDSV